MARIGVQRWSLNRRMRASVTLCHSLCTAARSPVVFLGNGFIPLIRPYALNNIDPLLASGGHKSPHWQETPRLSWLEDNYICQCMIINVWLIMRPEDVISIFLCS